MPLLYDPETEKYFPSHLGLTLETVPSMDGTRQVPAIVIDVIGMRVCLSPREAMQAAHALQALHRELMGHIGKD